MIVVVVVVVAVVVARAVALPPRLLVARARGLVLAVPLARHRSRPRMRSSVEDACVLSIHRFFEDALL
jgi:hypothetical protein